MGKILVEYRSDTAFRTERIPDFTRKGGGTVNGAFSFPKRGFQASSDVNDNSCGESVFEPPLSSGDLAKKKKNINFLSENGVTSFYNQWRLPVDVIRTTQSQCR